MYYIVSCRQKNFGRFTVKFSSVNEAFSYACELQSRFPCFSFDVLEIA